MFFSKTGLSGWGSFNLQMWILVNCWCGFKVEMCLSNLLNYSTGLMRTWLCNCPSTRWDVQGLVAARGCWLAAVEMLPWILISLCIALKTHRQHGWKDTHYYTNTACCHHHTFRDSSLCRGCVAKLTLSPTREAVRRGTNHKPQLSAQAAAMWYLQTVGSRGGDPPAFATPSLIPQCDREGKEVGWTMRSWLPISIWWRLGSA